MKRASIIGLAVAALVAAGVWAQQNVIAEQGNGGRFGAWAVSSVGAGQSGALTRFSCINDNVSSETQCVGLSGSGKSYYITGVVISASAAITVKIDSSTTAGNACATSPAVVIPQMNMCANCGAPLVFNQPIKVTANSALCCKPSGASASCIITGYIGP